VPNDESADAVRELVEAMARIKAEAPA